jgi:multiple sugar transport system ATP-binding protein
MATVSLQHIQKSYSGVPVIRDLSLEIADREFTVFVGPSGCGKSTLIRMIAGLEEIESGALLIDGQRMNDVGPADRGLAMVFQSYALYPHMTVRENMSFALRLARVPKPECQRKVADAARILDLESCLDRTPRELSGGQRQRVAIGRAIVRHPKAFLFDEPLSNLDAALRGQMRLELARLHEELAATMIYVTHDQVEAMTLGDRVVVLQAGRIEQVGTPLEVYRRPRNIFVAEFLGSPPMNFLPSHIAAVTDHGVVVALPGGGQLLIAAEPGSMRPLARATLGVRPEALHLDPEGALSGVVSTVQHLGAHSLLHVKFEQGGRVVMQTPGSSGVHAHERVRIALDAADCHVFDEAGLALVRNRAA